MKILVEPCRKTVACMTDDGSGRIILKWIWHFIMWAWLI